MKQSLFIIFLLIISSKAFSQGVWVPGVTFTYDNGGNRVIRQMELICLGGGCPPFLRHADTSGTAPATPAISSNEVRVKAYPNPVDNDLFVENLNWKESDKATVMVFDMNGKMAVKQDFTMAKDKVSFYRLPPGSYLVQYYLNDTMLEIWKIIKQ